MDTTESQLDLLTRIRIALEERNDAAEAFDVFSQDAVMAPAPDIDTDVTSAEAADAAAGEVDGFNQEVRALVRAASDADLVAAYRDSGGEIGDLAAESVLAEMKRRGLSG